MPVPVPLLSKPLAHPVFKPSQTGGNPGNAKHSVFQHLSHTLPISPIGRPPSFGTREEWINSLPPWRKSKPRGIWEDDARIGRARGELNFPEGFMEAPNASFVRGTHAHVRLPPVCTLQYSSFTSVSPETGLRQRCDEEADDEMSSDCSLMDQCHYDNESQWSASSPNERVEMVASEAQFGMVEDRPGWHRDDGVVFEEQVYEKGAFSPIYEDDSPQMLDGPDATSSPIGPTTPFGEFVDRVVAASQPYTSLEAFHVADDLVEHEGHYQYTDTAHGRYYQYPPYQDDVKELPPAPEPKVATPSTTISYKKLAEPLADWVATYVWKVCTTGMSLPCDLIVPSSFNQYSKAPPSHLAGLVHSLFLSTQLQPSAILLAMWYIVRLPVFFGDVGLGPEQVKELRFRAELLGYVPGGAGREVQETDVPFRLILLGCMLANKWLDDHTFSNKTWHTISHVPIESLNKLESLALDIFSHDLSTPSRAWSQWLVHLVAYHQSLSSPSHPQPISRPSTNPHSIVRKTLEDIMHAPASIDSSVPEPVFLGLEERKMEKRGSEESLAEGVDVYEIDLDKDGPLREEYLPKRRVSGAGSIRTARSRDTPDSKIHADQSRDWEERDAKAAAVEKMLPPPAKWSPEADEPIFRERGRTSGQYVAVQPPLAYAVPLPPYQQEVRYQSWPATAAFVPVNQHLSASFTYDPIPIQQTLPTYTPYPYIAANQTHSRSHSLSCDVENCQSRNHSRSYSQSVFDYRCSGIRMTANESVLPGPHDVRWDGAAQYESTAPHRQPFGPHPNVNYQSTWLRA